MLNKDMILGVFMSIFSTVMIFQSNSLVRRNQWDVLGPKGFPNAISWVLLGLSIFLIINSLRKNYSSEGKSKVNRLSITTFLMLFAYILIMPHMGFIVATFIFLLVLQLILDNTWKKSFVSITIISVISTGTVFLIFDKILNVYLPKLFG